MEASNYALSVHFDVTCVVEQSVRSLSISNRWANLHLRVRW